jgi:hypothetical protein
MMASFWPTPQAIQTMPAGVEGMNQSPKVVFSRTLDKASWNNTRLVKTRTRTFGNGNVFLCYQPLA